MLERYAGVVFVIIPIVVTTFVQPPKCLRRDSDEYYWGTILFYSVEHDGPFHHRFVLVPEWPRDMPIVRVDYHGMWPSTEACNGGNVVVRGTFSGVQFEAESIAGNNGGRKYDPCRRHRCLAPNSCDDRDDMRFP
jgi:hypothetical protein